jgi:hypothetical protein
MRHSPVRYDGLWRRMQFSWHAPPVHTGSRPQSRCSTRRDTAPIGLDPVPQALAANRNAVIGPLHHHQAATVATTIRTDAWSLPTLSPYSCVCWVSHHTNGERH